MTQPPNKFTDIYDDVMIIPYTVYSSGGIMKDDASCWVLRDPDVVSKNGNDDAATYVLMDGSVAITAIHVDPLPEILLGVSVELSTRGHKSFEEFDEIEKFHCLLNVTVDIKQFPYGFHEDNPVKVMLLQSAIRELLCIMTVRHNRKLVGYNLWGHTPYCSQGFDYGDNRQNDLTRLPLHALMHEKWSNAKFTKDIIRDSLCFHRHAPLEAVCAIPGNRFGFEDLNLQDDAVVKQFMDDLKP